MFYIMLTLSALLLGADFALNKIYQRTFGTLPKAVLLFNSLLGLATAVIFFAFNGFKLGFSAYSLMMAGIMSTFVMSYNILGFRLLKSGTLTLYTLFLMTGGMVLPYIYGLFFLHENFSLLRTAGLILILSGVILSNFNGEHINVKQIILCTAVFILNGFVSIISKMHQSQEKYAVVNSTEFIILGGIFKFFLAGFLFLIFKNKTPDHQSSGSFKKALLIIIGSASIGGSSYLLQLFSAKMLPATLLYPFITGGSIIFSALADLILFKEKISSKMLLSIFLCFAGTVMFL